MYLLQNNSHIVLLSEIFLKPSKSFNNPNYCTLRNDRIDQQRDSVAFLIKKKVTKHTAKVCTSTIKLGMQLTFI